MCRARRLPKTLMTTENYSTLLTPAEAPDKGVGTGDLLAVHGFWRSPSGENHGRDSRPGDVWYEPGDITDTDRLDHLIKTARRGDMNYWLEIGVPHWMNARAAIDREILSSANTEAREPGTR